MNVIKVFLLLLSIGVIAGQKIYTKMEDEFSSYGGGNNAVRIRVPRGSRIVFYLDEITLQGESTLTIRDGRGEAFVFKRYGSNILKAPEKDKYNLSRVNIQKGAPWKYVSENRKLTIFYEVSQESEGYSAHYIAFTDTGCEKSYLNHAVETAIQSVECDTVDGIPKASQCDVTIECTSSYQQNDKTMTCSRGEWRGDIMCEPIETEMQKCTYDFDEFTVDSNCPYQPSEVARYYLDSDDLEGFDISIGRSNGRGIRLDCNPMCAITASGRRAVTCGKLRQHVRGERFAFIKCMICRIVYKCSRRIVVF